MARVSPAPLEVEKDVMSTEDSFSQECSVKKVVRQVFLFSVCGIYTLGFVVVTSGMGIGVRTAVFSNRMAGISNCLIASGLGFAWLGYIGEVQKRGRWIVGSVAGLLFGTGFILGVDRFPYASLSVYVFFKPLVCGCIPHYILEGKKSNELTHFLNDLRIPCIVLGISTGLAWIYWASNKRWHKMRERYGPRLHANGFKCRRTYEKNWMDEDEINELKAYSKCTEAFLIWVQPWIYAWSLLIFAGLSHFATRQKVPNKFMLTIAFLIMGAWAAASLAGAGHGVTSAIVAYILASALGLCLSGIYAFGFYDFCQRLAGHNATLQKKFVSPYVNAWRGLAVLTLWPFFCFGYLPTAIIKNCIRARFRRSDKNKHILTEEARTRLETLSKWNWTKVLQWSCFFGFAQLALIVFVAKFTVLLMSVVVVKCANASILIATLIIVAVGLLLFLLPPVPGAPIYLAAGVLLIPVTRANGWQVSVGIVYSACICLAIKLLACAAQQKLIGEPLAHSLWVRKTVGMNSKFIRTTRLVLAEPGLSLTKCALLVGGPDWPTSVACGIMRLPLLPILAGTLPVWILIWPTVLGGAFMVIDEPSSQVLSTLFVSSAAIVQSGSLAVAAVRLNIESERRKDEIDLIPLDLEVEQCKQRDQERRLLYDTKTHWRFVPLFFKGILILCVLMLSIAVYLSTLFPSLCFRHFSVNDRISKRLQGKWTRILRPAGYLVIFLFACAILLYAFFEFAWAARVVHNARDDLDLESSDKRSAPSAIKKTGKVEAIPAQALATGTQTQNPADTQWCSTPVIKLTRAFSSMCSTVRIEQENSKSAELVSDPDEGDFKTDAE